MRYWTAAMARADAVLFGRVTYEMMESAWRKPATGTWPDWMDEWEIPFAEAIDRAKKHVVSSTLGGVDWNAELLPGDVGQAVERLKQSKRDLARAVAAMDDAALTGPVVGRDHTRIAMLHGIVEHDTYHGGQIALLRKLVIDRT